MATSPDAFQKVKEILRKLDRSIDSARDRRLSGTEGPAPIPSPVPAARPEPVTPVPADGAPLRARPMRPTPDLNPPKSVWGPATGTNGLPGR